MPSKDDKVLRSGLIVRRKVRSTRAGAWSQADEDWLVQNWDILSTELLAKHLGRQPHNITIKARNLKLPTRHTGARSDPGSISEVCVGLYDTDTSEFLRAVTAFHFAHRRWPTSVEGFRIAKQLGWAKR